MYLDQLLSRIDPEIEHILQKAMDHNQISEKDAERLFNVENEELMALLFVANNLTEQIHKREASYVLNRNINFTNICANNCSFCGFRRENSSKDAYTLGIDNILKKIDAAIKTGASEVCMQGGLNSALDCAYIENIVKEISMKFPNIHIHAFSPMEIYYYAQKSDLTTKEVLCTLKEAGLGSICGTAAEILDDSIRKTICPQKIDTKTWVVIIKEAHKMGLPSTSTILYGHIEDAKSRVLHMQILKKIQNLTKNFTEFIPLRFIHYNSTLTPSKEQFLDLKMIAIARLYFIDSIVNIQASWIKLGHTLAGLMLRSGANDIGGTLIEENIIKGAGKHINRFLNELDMVNLIKSVGLVPKKRDTLYTHQN